jgi:regulator of PEP synthase PpsR (kinase-PPPase family)
MNTLKKDKACAPIYVVSGGKGLAGNNLVQSLLIQYPNNNVPLIIVPQVQEKEELVKLVEKVKNEGGLITHTMVNRGLRAFLCQLCVAKGVKHIDYMGELADYLDEKLQMPSLQSPGLYREINQQYYDRIEAIEFTLNHDDGLKPNRLHKAEIIRVAFGKNSAECLSGHVRMESCQYSTGSWNRTAQRAVRSRSAACFRAQYQLRTVDFAPHETIEKSGKYRQYQLCG